jgi:hypothetical protein
MFIALIIFGNFFNKIAQKIDVWNVDFEVGTQSTRKTKKISFLGLSFLFLNYCNYLVYFNTPGTIRTCDLLIRSQTLYPAELRVHNANIKTTNLNEKCQVSISKIYLAK